MSLQTLNRWQQFRAAYPELAAVALQALELPPLSPTDRPQVEYEFNDTPVCKLEFAPNFEPDVLTLYAVTAADRQLVLVSYQKEILLNRLPKQSVVPDWRIHHG